jgi:hypothetical protein
MEPGKPLLLTILLVTGHPNPANPFPKSWMGDNRFEPRSVVD